MFIYGLIITCGLNDCFVLFMDRAHYWSLQPEGNNLNRVKSGWLGSNVIFCALLRDPDLQMLSRHLRLMPDCLLAVITVFHRVLQITLKVHHQPDDQPRRHTVAQSDKPLK